MSRIYRGMAEEEVYDRFEYLPWAHGPSRSYQHLEEYEAWDTIIESRVMSRSSQES